MGAIQFLRQSALRAIATHLAPVHDVSPDDILHASIPHRPALMHLQGRERQYKRDSVPALAQEVVVVNEVAWAGDSE